MFCVVKRNLSGIVKFKALLLLIILLPYGVKASFELKKDSIPPALDSVPVYFNSDMSSITYRDSSLDEISRYFNVFKRGNFYASNGHLTLPSRNLLYGTQVVNPLGFANHNFEPIFFDTSNDLYAHTFYPVTDVTAVVGTGKEQFVQMMHSQNISPGFNFTVMLNGLRTAGYYARQQANDINFKSAASYFSKKGLYKMFFSFNYNKMLTDMNGGIQPTDSGGFDYSEVSDKALLPVYLNEAKHQLIQTSVYTKQVFGLDRKVNQSSIPYRTLDTLNALNKIELTGGYKEFYRFYSDRDDGAGYYKNFFIDSVDSYKNRLKVQESFGTIRIHNKVNERPYKNKLAYSLLFGVNNIDVSMVENYTGNYFTTYIQAETGKNIGNMICSVKSKYFLNGYNTKDNFSEIKIEDNGLQKINWSIAGQYSLVHPQGIYNYYISNNFKWSNKFENAKTLSVNGKAGNDKFGFLQLDMYKINNYLYFDSLAMPAQYSKDITLLQARYYKIFRFYHLRFSQEVLYQKENSAEQVLGVPEFFIKSGLYLEGKLFKSVLLYQFGIDMYWLSSYTPYGYMPATNVYYYQNAFQTGNLPLADVFLSFKIKTVRAFVRAGQLSNIGQPLYFYVPYNPVPGFTLKLGINWLFKK